jgi:hypothetical protein
MLVFLFLGEIAAGVYAFARREFVCIFTIVFALHDSTEYHTEV